MWVQTIKFEVKLPNLLARFLWGNRLASSTAEWRQIKSTSRNCCEVTESNQHKALGMLPDTDWELTLSPTSKHQEPPGHDSLTAGCQAWSPVSGQGLPIAGRGQGLITMAPAPGSRENGGRSVLNIY